MEAEERRQQREAKKRQRELERQSKELAKLSALEQARLEVETYENNLDVLLSVHKEKAEAWDWRRLAASLPPAPPQLRTHNELKTRQLLMVSASHNGDVVAIRQAQQQDEKEYQDALQAYTVEYAEWKNLSILASRILLGQHGAYIEALQEFNPFNELACIGSSLNFTVHNAHLVECVLSTNSNKTIPSEVKTLSSSGKVTVKQMPRQRFVEIYQDYVCGCVLRVAREVFALLPVDMIIITAFAEYLDTATGLMLERPFLSVVIAREILNSFNFDKLDPSDSIMGLPHRGELNMSRKTGKFDFISPLTPADMDRGADESANFEELMDAVKRRNSELAHHIATLTQ